MDACSASRQGLKPCQSKPSLGVGARISLVCCPASPLRDCLGQGTSQEGSLYNFGRRGCRATSSTSSWLVTVSERLQVGPWSTGGGTTGTRFIQFAKFIVAVAEASSSRQTHILEPGWRVADRNKFPILKAALRLTEPSH